MDKHDLTKIQMNGLNDISNTMAQIPNVQNHSHPAFQGKKQFSARKSPGFAVATPQDTLMHTDEPQKTAKVSSTPVEDQNTFKSFVKPLLGPAVTAQGSTNSRDTQDAALYSSGVLQNNSGFKSAQEVFNESSSSKSYLACPNASQRPPQSTINVSAFAMERQEPDMHGSLAAQPTSVFQSGMAEFASTKHLQRGNPQYLVQGQTFVAQHQPMIAQPIQMTPYLQQFIAIASTQPQSATANSIFGLPMMMNQNNPQQFSSNQQIASLINAQQNAQQHMHALQASLENEKAQQDRQLLQELSQLDPHSYQLLIQHIQNSQQEMQLQQNQTQMGHNEAYNQIAQLTSQLQAAGYFQEREAPQQQFPYMVQQQSVTVCCICQKAGELIGCATCQKPHHLQCAKLTQLPTQRWECEECTIISRENLIRELKENAQRKAQERERRKEEEKQAKNEAKMRRELELKMRREEKERLKEEQRKQKIEQTLLAITQKKEDREIFIDPDTGKPYDVQGPLKIGQDRSELLLNAATIAKSQAQKQLVFGPDGSLVQTTQNLQPTKKKKQEIEMTPEEKARFERNRLIKQQLQIFTNAYPELVEKNSVKYPIKDELLVKLPELHGVCLDPKPEPFKILVSAEEFEKLIYIWEFCNNFCEYLDTPTFKIEDLKCALSYSEQDDPTAHLSLQGESELEWSEQMRVKHIREKGLHMINSLHAALVTCFLDDFFPDNSTEENATTANTRSQPQTSVQLVSAQSEKDNYILQAIHKLIENKEEVWPEIIRLVLTYKKEEDGEDFGPDGETIEQILPKLVGLRPASYSQELQFTEKVTLLTVLIDGIHDTDDFRKFLNERVEEKSSFNKEKIEVYQAIRQFEQEQQELVKRHADSNFVNNQEQVNKELEELRKQLSMASRVQSRDIWARIKSLESEKNAFVSENSRLDELIKKKHAQIVKLNEKLYKSSIKTMMLGQDAQRSEYWHFKDDQNRIYIRKEEVLTNINSEMKDGEEGEQNVQANQIVRFNWFYYENEEQLDQLLERLNTKGIRERKLQESVRKVKDILKLKKPNKAKTADATSEKLNQNAEDSLTGKDEQMKDTETEGKAEDPSANVDEQDNSETQTAETRHVMFETDSYSSCLRTAVWFGKKIPPKRRLFGRGAANYKSDASELGDSPVSLFECQNLLIKIQKMYTDGSKANEREWADKTEREAWQKQILAATSCQQIVELLIKLDEGMSQPFYFAQRGNSGQTQRLKLQLFKFWPSTELKLAWRTYTDDENSLKSENLNALFIILRILERITEQFLVRQSEKMEKKNKAAINAVNNERVTAQQQILNSRNRQGQKEINYVKYFQSSDSEEEDQDRKSEKHTNNKKVESEDESEPEDTLKSGTSARHQRLIQRKPTKSVTSNKSKTVGNRKKVVESDSEDISESQQSENESSEEEKATRGRFAQRGRGRGNLRGGRGRQTPNQASKSVSDQYSEESSEQDTSREWDEYCYICQDGGNVLCCDGCQQVAHLSCLKLKLEPTGDWHCADCLKKMTMKRLTRNMETKHEQKSNINISRRNGGKPVKAYRRY